MRALVAIAALSIAGCGYYAYEPIGGRNTGCGGIYFDCTTDAATDNRTGLMWLRTRKVGNFAAAQQQCDDLRTEGKFDWRLPTLAELKSVEDSHFEEEGYQLDPDVFPVDGSLPYFSTDAIDDQQVKGWYYVGGDPPLGYVIDPNQPGCAASTGPAGETKLFRQCSAFFRCVRGP